jgi:DNA repair protein RadC
MFDDLVWRLFFISMNNALLKIAEIQLAYRNTVKPSERIKINRPVDAYNVFLETWNMNTIELVEEFKILLLNRANKVLGLAEISSGGITCVTIDIRLVFAVALKAAATSLICCHNHPSGNLKAGREDSGITERLREAGRLLDISVDDHIIITRDGYYSFAEQGEL